MKILRNDKVKVISGNNKGKEGTVIAVDKDNGRLLIEGVNLVKKHLKPNQANQTGGIIEREAFLPVCKVMVICGSCGKATRIGKSRKEDGSVVRICKACKKPL